MYYKNKVNILQLKSQDSNVYSVLYVTVTFALL